MLRDPDGRVLLVRSRFRRAIEGVDFAWFVPGGGLEPGESPSAAAVREVWEETGITLDEGSLVHVATSSGVGTVGEMSGLMRDDFYLAMTEATDLSRVNMEPGERAAFGEYRWCCVAELATLTEPVFPAGLAQLLSDYDRAMTWPEPRMLPW